MPQTKLTGRNDLLKVVLPAAARGDLRTVRQLLKDDHTWLFARGPHGRSMLWEASYKNRVDTVRYLAEQGADVNVCATYYTPLVVDVTPYCLAVSCGHQELADTLADCGAVVDLHSAAYLGDVDHARKLLDEHPDLLHDRPRMDTGTPVVPRTATFNKTIRTTLARIEQEAEKLFAADLADAQETLKTVKLPNYKKLEIGWGYGRPYRSRVDEIGHLIRRVATGTVSARNRFAVMRELHFAWFRLKRRWQKNFPAPLDEPLLTPLHYAVLGRQPEMVEFLISRGADVRRFGGFLAQHSREPEMEGILRRLVQHGADMQEAVDSTWLADPRLKRIAERSGVRNDIDDAAGKFPPLIDACRGNHNAPDDPARVQSILDMGASVHVTDDKGKTALHRAAQAGFRKIGTLLLQAGANVEAKDAQGETPLFDAVRHGRIVTTRLLLKHGAKPDVENNIGRTLLQIAKRSKKKDRDSVLRVLQRALNSRK